jgi:hypothetical protein
MDPTDKLPPIAYLDNRNGAIAPDVDAPVIAVKRGQAGYYPIHTRKTADELNRIEGVSLAQREAMLAGSMFGWGGAAADPDRYNADGTQKRTA